ncbi:MAG: hypothetical protein WKF75_14160 [Singulisphaera sp.]
MDARHRARHAAAVAALMDSNPFLPGHADQATRAAPWTSRCHVPRARRRAMTGPGPQRRRRMDDSHVWPRPTSPPEADLAAQIDVESRHYHAREPFGNLIAKRLEAWPTACSSWVRRRSRITRTGWPR